MTDKVQSESSPHRYFTMMLNMAEDDLDPFEYRLLAHYVRWSSAGPICEGIRTTATKCKMSTTKVKKVRETLASAGYLSITPPPKKGAATVITVLDRWAENTLRYTRTKVAEDTKCSKSDTPEKGGCSKSDTPGVVNLIHIEEQEKNIEEPIAQPDGSAGNGAGLDDKDIDFVNQWVTVIDAMVRFPDAPFYDSRHDAWVYLTDMKRKAIVTPDMEADEVLAIVKRELITPPDEPTPKRERPRNPWYDAIAETTGAEGYRNTRISNVLQAKGKGAYAKYNLETPFTEPAQVHVFWKWYQKVCPGCDLASEATVQDYVMRWQREGCPDVQAQPQPKTEAEIAKERLEMGLPYVPTK